MDYFSFTETLRFERNVEKLFDDDGLGELQLFLCQFPERGKTIPGSGGIRKLRWGVTGPWKTRRHTDYLFRCRKPVSYSFAWISMQRMKKKI